MRVLHPVRLCITSLLAVILLAVSSPSATAAVITDSEVSDIPANAVGSGNGTLDLILFTESSGGSTNSSGPFNGDNANTDEPTGGSGDSSDESYITSFGDLRAFYRFTFPSVGPTGSTVNQIALFVDVNEVGQVLTIDMDKLNIWTDVDSFGDNRDSPFTTDISSSLQNSTNTSFSGGTLIANLDAGPKLLTYHNNGAGHGDMVILTGIDPFDVAFSDSTKILFNLGLSDMSNGGETVFLSGTYAPQDVTPEPTTLVLLAASGVVLVAGRRRRSA